MPGLGTGHGLDIGLGTHHGNLPATNGEGFRPWAGKVEGVNGGTMDNQVGWLTILSRHTATPG
jgi:hypothetical protein